MSVKEIDRFEALATDLGVEVHSAGGKTAHLENAVHALGREVNARGELVRVPPEHRVTSIRIDGSERPGPDGGLELVHHLVASQGGVVGLKVKLEVREQLI